MKMPEESILTERRRELDYLNRTRGLTIRAASAGEIPSLLLLAHQLLPHSTVELSTAEHIQKWNSETLLSVDGADSPIGAAAMLSLNSRGLDALLTGGFCFERPSLHHISRTSEPPAGIYVWAICLRGRAVSAVAAIMEWSKRDGRENAHLYARPVTFEGERFMRRGGFRPIPCGQPDLWRYERPLRQNVTIAA